MGSTQPDDGASTLDAGGDHDGLQNGPRRRRAALVAAPTVVAAALAVVLAVVVGAGDGTTTAGHGAGRTTAPRPGELSAVVSDQALSPAADVDAPPPDPDPAAPGQVVRAGVDQSDPFLLEDGTRYYLYTSGMRGPPAANVPVTSATDFGSWVPVTDALPDLPPWVAAGFTWAPDVHRFGDRFVLYFTALLRGSSPSMECIGDAVGASPTGPFLPFPEPFICQPLLGGDIDPRVFVADDGTPYMLWKSDQNIGGASTPTQMWSQPLTADGLALTGRPGLLLEPGQPWEGTIVEAPDMVDVHGALWMIFSGNWFNQPSYAIGAARCLGPQGPCADVVGNPLLGSNAQGQGPGEASLFADTAGVWMLYSPWRSLSPHPDLPRPVVITRLGFGEQGPYLAAGGPPPSLLLLPLGPAVGSAP
jgi:glycosyl hydrolase family 43